MSQQIVQRSNKINLKNIRLSDEPFNATNLPISSPTIEILRVKFQNLKNC